MNNHLIKLDKAKQLLAEVNSIKEVLPLIKQAEMAEVYFKKVKLGEEAEMYARAIKLEAQRKAGVFLSEQPKLHGARPADTGLPDVTPLKDIGVSKRQSSDWQQMKNIPEESFELVKQGKKTLKKAKSEIRKAKRLQEAQELDEATELTDVELINDDFRLTKFKDADLILTDPPYPQEYLHLWEDLAEYANETLKPGGFLVAYSGQLHLPEIYKMLSKHLKYYWTYCLYHIGATQIVHPRNVMCRWKPILVFQKEPFKKRDIVFQDYIISENREKDGHDWQQSESGVCKLLEMFSKPGDTVIDPFMGAGTFPYVAHKMKRKAIGIEIDKDSYHISKARFND